MGGGQPVAKLHVEVREARKLNPRSFTGRCNSHVTVHWEGEQRQTDTIKHSIKPKWHTEFIFDVYEHVVDQRVVCSVMEKPPCFGLMKMGEVSFPLSKFQERLNWDEWFTLVPTSPSHRRDVGDLHLLFSLRSDGDLDAFQRFLQGLRIENDWVVLDPQMDSFSVTDSIVPPPSPFDPSQSSSLDEPIEFKNEEPEEEDEDGSFPSFSVHNEPHPHSFPTLGGDVVPAGASPEIVEFLLREQEEQERQLRELMSRCRLCEVVQDAGEGHVIDLDCGHIFCAPCIQHHSLEALTNPQCIEIPCAAPGCSSFLPQWALRRVMDPEVFDQFLMRAVTLAIEKNEEMFRCPNPACGSVVERVQAVDSPAHVRMAYENSSLSPEAQAHLDQYRFRCRDCSTEFCSSCFRTPYHVGFTCSQFTEYLNGRRCRYCESSINDQERGLSGPRKFDDVCDEEECQEKMKDACVAVHPCGHPCGGVEGETHHLPCLHEDCVKGGRQDESDFCNVCFVEGLGSAPCIQLECSHILHYRCALAKLRQRWPSARVTFGFRDCPICKTPMNHPALEEELRPIAKMEEEIANNAVQRLSFEGLENHEDIKKPTGRFYQNPKGFAMNRFAYYPCFKCKKPYFGGQQRCDAGDRDRDFKPDELVCGGCSGADQGGCTIHGKEFMEHKCQYCCGVASWFCWGKTHFCDDCHTRQQKGDYVSKYEQSRLPQCPGKDECPLGIDHPPNGTPFCMGCAFCRQNL